MREYPDVFWIEGEMIFSPYAYMDKYCWFEDTWKKLPEKIRNRIESLEPRMETIARWKFIDNWTEPLIGWLFTHDEGKNTKVNLL